MENRIHCGWIKTTEIKSQHQTDQSGRDPVIPTNSVTNLGVIVDENLSMYKHIAKVFRAVCISIRNNGIIRKHINQPVAELLTHALITSRLDTCNSLLHGLNKTQLKRL